MGFLHESFSAFFPTSQGRSGSSPTGHEPNQRLPHDPASCRGRRDRDKIGCHTFRATGITEYLRNGGKLEIAQQMANDESARTTGLYDRRDDQLTLDEAERTLI